MKQPSDRWAAVFTRNMFPGAPVIVGKERLAAEGRAIQAVVVNNKVRLRVPHCCNMLLFVFYCIVRSNLRLKVVIISWSSQRKGK